MRSICPAGIALLERKYKTGCNQQPVGLI